jgi:hypothetical protein
VSTDKQDHSRLGVAIAGLRDGFAQIGRVDIEDLTHLARVARSVLEGFVAAGILTDDESQDPDAVMSEGEQGYQEAIDVLESDPYREGGLAYAVRLLEEHRDGRQRQPALPRSWSLPTIPAGVRLRDERDGHTWTRCVEQFGPGKHWTDGEAVISLGQLLQTRGRLTEVVDGD